jgi:hypothetical protein
MKHEVILCEEVILLLGGLKRVLEYVLNLLPLGSFVLEGLSNLKLALYNNEDTGSGHSFLVQDYILLDVIFLQAASDLGQRVSRQQREHRYIPQEVYFIVKRTSLDLSDSLIEGIFGQNHKMGIFQAPDSSHSWFLLQEGKFPETLAVRQGCNSEEAWLRLI